MKTNKSNTELIKLLKKGDMMAFDAIYNKYCHKLFGFVMRYLKQEEDTEEIVQEVFVKIWESRDKINEYSSFEAFLFTIAYNSTMSLLRKRVTERKSKEYLKEFQQIGRAESVIDELNYQDLNDKLKSLLDQLTPRQKEIFLLSREEELSHKEIAAKLNVSENTVKNHMVIALKFLRQNLDKHSISILFYYLFLMQ